MTTDEVLKIVKERGLTVELRDGRPHLIGSGPEVTDRLLAVLKLHREWIIERLKNERN